MAVTPRNSSWGGSSTNISELLVGYITTIIQPLEPELQYARLGTRKDAPSGFDRIVFPQPNQVPVKINIGGSTVGGPTYASIWGGSVWGAGVSILTGSESGAPVSSTAGVTAIVEGTNPTAITWGATSFATGPAQYGVLVQVTDLLVRNSAIEVIQEASRQVQYSLTRMVDTVLQTVVNAASNGIIYSGSKTARTSLTASDTVSVNDMIKAVTWMRQSNAAGVKPFAGGMYGAVIAPVVMGDLMSTTATGSWIDAARFTDASQIKDGTMRDYRGLRYLESAYQNFFNSTVPVMPTTVLGEDSFGWGYFQAPQAILTTTPDAYNPLNLYSSIGGKVTLGATRFNDTPGNIRIVRVESAFTA